MTLCGEVGTSLPILTVFDIDVRLGELCVGKNDEEDMAISTASFK